MRTWPTLLLASLLLAGCELPTPDPLPPSTDGDVALAVVAGDLDQPVFAAPAPGGGLLVVEQDGRIVRVGEDGGAAGTFLDIRDRVRDGGERGLLGLAMEPGGDRLYVHYTDDDGDVVIARFLHDGTSAAAASEEILLTVDEPYSNHNGGHVAFGPDGHLYIALGDGGAANDPQNHGQDPDTLLGAILRIDVSLPVGYAVPGDNPFADGGGAAEVYVWGLRNPWRFSFDAGNGDLWIGDVGQNAWEEIDRLAPSEAAGANMGWPALEGTHDNPARGDEPPDDAIPPVFEYSNSGAHCAVTGGYVYRGDAIPALVGQYVYGDYCSGAIWAFDLETGTNQHLLDAGSNVSSFAEDADAELLVVGHGPGSVQRLVME